MNENVDFVKRRFGERRLIASKFKDSVSHVDRNIVPFGTKSMRTLNTLLTQSYGMISDDLKLSLPIPANELYGGDGGSGDDEMGIVDDLGLFLSERFRQNMISMRNNKAIVSDASHLMRLCFIAWKCFMNGDVFVEKRQIWSRLRHLLTEKDHNDALFSAEKIRRKGGITLYVILNNIRLFLLKKSFKHYREVVKAIKYCLKKHLTLWQMYLDQIKYWRMTGQKFLSIVDNSGYTRKIYRIIMTSALQKWQEVNTYNFKMRTVKLLFNIWKSHTKTEIQHRLKKIKFALQEWKHIVDKRKQRVSLFVNKLAENYNQRILNKAVLKWTIHYKMQKKANTCEYSCSLFHFYGQCQHLIPLEMITLDDISMREAYDKAGLADGDDNLMAEADISYISAMTSSTGLSDERSMQARLNKENSRNTGARTPNSRRSNMSRSSNDKMNQQRSTRNTPVRANTPGTARPATTPLRSSITSNASSTGYAHRSRPSTQSKSPYAYGNNLISSQTKSLIVTQPRRQYNLQGSSNTPINRTTAERQAKRMAVLSERLHHLQDMHASLDEKFHSTKKEIRKKI
jgi:hypothetical protein